MSLLYCYDLAYRKLLTIDVETSDPSETLNLIDLARSEAAFIADVDLAKRIEAKCKMMELNLHMVYTPPSLAFICVE